METPSQIVPVSLDQGIDISVSEQGQGRGAANMINLDFGAEAEVRPRGIWETVVDSAGVNVAPGVLLPAPTVPAHRRASTLPLETACIARAATSARLFGAQAATDAGFTLMALTCRDESATAVAADDPDNYVDLIAYNDDGTVITTTRFDPSLPIADVRVAVMVPGVGSIRQFLLTYVDPSSNTLLRRVVQLDYNAPSLTVGSATTLFSSVDADNWVTSVHAVEADNTGTQLVVFTTSGGTLRYVVIDGLTGSVGTPVNTSLVNTIYTEMASCHADGIITILTGHSSTPTDIGIYSFNDVTLSVASHFHTFPTLTLNRRLAVVPDDFAGSTNVVAFVELTNGLDAVLSSASLGVLSTMGELQSVRLADAGTWLEENELTGDTGAHRVPLIGLTAAEAVKTNFRSHVVARVFFDANAIPRLSAAAIVAHSDAGVMHARLDFVLPRTRVGPLARYAFNGGPTVRLPVLVVTRTTADRTVASEGSVDLFDRAVRLTTLTSNAHQHHGVVTLGHNTFVGGSVPSSWDGESLVPIGFPLPPRTAKSVDNGVTASGLNDGRYEYRVRQSYQDRQGTLYDSPIVYLNGTASISNDAGSTPRLTIYPGTLWSNMMDVEADARFVTEVFRNPDTIESGDITSRKAYTVSHGAVAPSKNIVDTRSAATIATGELLPDLVSGAITSGPLPALSYLFAHRSRLFGVDAYDQELIRFTTEYAAPTAPLWNDALSVRVTNSGGPVYAGASLADKCVVFQENQICVMNGEGPDGTGRGTFSYPESLRGVGCRPGSQGAVVEVPSGVMFVHQTGIYHLGFDLALTPVGNKLVERIAEPGRLAPIKRAVYLPSRAQVWFLTDGTASGQLGEPDILVWDVTRSRWTAFSSAYGPFSDVRETPGGVYLMDGRGRLLKAHRGSNLHDLDEVGDLVEREMSVLLPWMRADNARQLRLRKLHISGYNEDVVATLQATITTHNESRGSSEDSTSTRTFDMSAQASGNFQTTVRAVTQRCHSVQCKLEIISAEDEAVDQELRLSTLSYEISVLPGTGKVPTGKRPA